MTFPTEWLAVRALVLVRCSQVCEGCGVVRAEEVHHRQPRGMGGLGSVEARIAGNNPSNLLALCLGCHRFTEDEPTAARAKGWLVPHPLTPVLIPARIVPIYGEGWYYLLGNLGYKWCADHAALSTLTGYGLSTLS